MLTTSDSRWRSYGIPCTIAFNFPIDLQIFKIKMSIKQDTMNEVKIQDINTKYVLLSITGFRV